MSTLYLIFFIVSATGFTADIILRYVEKIKSFGVTEMPRLPEKFSATVPLGKLLPESFTMLLLMIMAGSAAGSLMTLARLPWFLSLPCSFASGFMLCFFLQYYVDNAFNALLKNNLPKGEDASGLDGFCTVEFVDGFGKVKLFHKDREFEVNAGISADENSENPPEIAVYDKVAVLYESGGFYFVAKPGDIYDGIDTKF
jgi:hypothetical protein